MVHKSVGLVFKVKRAQMLEGAVETALIIKGFDEVEDGLGFHRLNRLIPLVGVSERMRKILFNISRCWRRYSFSRCKSVFSTSSCSALRLALLPPFPPEGCDAKRPHLQALSRSGRIPSSAATAVAVLPLLDHNSTARCLKALSNLVRDFLVWITYLFIDVLLSDVSRCLCPPNRRSPRNKGAA